MVHMPLTKVTENPALLSLLMDMRVNAISGACMAFLNIVFVLSDPFGSSIWRSPILTAFNNLLSVVVIFYCTIL